MSDLQRAVSIAAKYHRNQKDSEGTPKIIHSLSVMFNMETEDEMIVGVLHDVVEDTEYTLKRLKKDGFSVKILNSIDCITHREKEEYQVYIERVKKNEISLNVKLSDLNHNMDVRRMNNITEEQMIKYIKKYKPTWDKLKNIKPTCMKREGKQNTRINLHLIYRKIYKYMKRMIEMNDLEKAISIAVKAHENQKDKAGMPYILHPLYIMTKMETELERIVGVLHDVIEDSQYNLDYLKKQGFSKEIIDAIDCLTKREDEEYSVYIDRVETNVISKKVKIAELEHNMDLKRLSNITEEDILRIVKKYKPAWDKLKRKVDDV
jgi:(p)ppGpp synthase/HD superfamily hydrolase